MWSAACGRRTASVGAVLCALLAGALGGCVTHEPMQSSYPGPEALPAAMAERYGYQDSSIDSHSERVTRRFGVGVREIVLSSSLIEGDEIRFELYETAGDAPGPVVLVLPIFNGNLLVSRYFARYFVNRGLAAVVVDRGRTEVRMNLASPEEALRRNLIEYRLVLDWLMEHAQVDAARVGVFGISFGGMDAVMLAGLDDRIGAVVAAMAGGDVAYTLMNTTYGMVNRALADVLDESGLSREEFERQFEETIATEPLALAPYVDAQDVLLILTRADTIVPFETQEALRDGIGEPESFYLPSGHRTSIFYFPFLREAAYDFFARRFHLPAEPVASN